MCIIHFRVVKFNAFLRVLFPFLLVVKYFVFKTNLPITTKIVIRTRRNKTLLGVVKLILWRCGDVERNPGPTKSAVLREVRKKLQTPLIKECHSVWLRMKEDEEELAPARETKTTWNVNFPYKKNQLPPFWIKIAPICPYYETSVEYFDINNHDSKKYDEERCEKQFDVLLFIYNYLEIQNPIYADIIYYYQNLRKSNGDEETNKTEIGRCLKNIQWMKEVNSLTTQDIDHLLRMLLQRRLGISENDIPIPDDIMRMMEECQRQSVATTNPPTAQTSFSASHGMDFAVGSNTNTTVTENNMALQPLQEMEISNNTILNQTQSSMQVGISSQGYDKERDILTEILGNMPSCADQFASRADTWQCDVVSNLCNNEQRLQHTQVDTTSTQPPFIAVQGMDTAVGSRTNTTASENNIMDWNSDELERNLEMYVGSIVDDLLKTDDVPQELDKDLNIDFLDTFI